MVFEGTYNLVRNFFQKLSFYKFHKKDYLFIVDTEFERYPIQNVEYYNIKKIYLRYIPIISILNFNNSKNIYFKNIIETIYPKKIVSNNLNIFANKFKMVSRNLKYYIYQHSYIYDDEIENFKNLYKNIKVDIFFCFDDRHKKIFSKFLDTKFIIIGSFRNNFVYTFYKKKYRRINYISEYRGKNQLKISQNNESYLVRLLSKICKRNNFSLFISLNSNRSDKKISKKEEIKYYKNIIKDFDYNELDVYQNSKSSLLSISMSSNAGVEILSRGIPLIYYDLMSIKNKKFKNPYFSKTSLFYYNKKLPYHQFENDIMVLIKKVTKNNKDITPKTILYDKNNKIFIRALYS